MTKIDELIEAGKKATQGEWHTVGLPWNNASPYIIAGHHDPHVGKGILDVIEQDCFEGETDADIEEAEQLEAAEQQANCEFVCAAKNALPALEQLLEESEWQDISTAPRDGTLVLVTAKLDVWISSRKEGQKLDNYGGTGWDWYLGERDRSYMPTHWMPLPEPPKGEEHE